MKDDKSPNSLKPPEVSVARMAKWPMYVAALAVLCLFGVLFYSVNYSHAPKKGQAASKPVAEEKPFVTLEGHGLSLPSPEKGVVTPQAATPEADKKAYKPVVVVHDNGPAKSSEYEDIRRQKAQAYVKALSSPLLAKRTSHTETGSQKQETRQTTETKQNPESTEARQMLLDMQRQRDPAAAQNDYNPAADRDKEGFFKRTAHDEWLSPYSREAGRPFEIKTGTVIPGVMVSGINSDLPGNLIAQVSQNVYDTATGHQLLIPQGSKLYGAYDSRVIYGQSRVLIAWNRIIFPDGSAVTLGAMPGVDMSGYAGFSDQVNNHYWRIFGSSMLMSLITGGTSYAADSISNTNSNSNGSQTTVQDAMASALASQLGQTTQTLLQRNLNIKPTLEIRPGYQFNVVVTKDVVFKQPYSSKPAGINNG